MTYVDKYLKDGVDVDKIVYDFVKWLQNNGKISRIEIERITQLITEYLNSKVKPTLSEDEKVILRNIQHAYGKIKRYGCDLYVLYNNGTCSDDIPLPFNHLFKFIKPRRRI